MPFLLPSTRQLVRRRLRRNTKKGGARPHVVVLTAVGLNRRERQTVNQKGTCSVLVGSSLWAQPQLDKRVFLLAGFPVREVHLRPGVSRASLTGLFLTIQENVIGNKTFAPRYSGYG